MTDPFRLHTLDGLSLEAAVDRPSGDPGAVLVLCHPHPKMGGTMNAPLLLAVRDRLLEEGWAVLRFNFRGIGDSDGSSSTGLDEVEDAIAAVEEAEKRFPGLPVAIAGWSFGAAVAVRVAAVRPDLAACVAIAPPVHEKPGITVGLPPAEDTQIKVPTYFIVGINDDLVDPEDCAGWARSAGITCTVMPGSNHFFWGKYDALADEIIRSLEVVS